MKGYDVIVPSQRLACSAADAVNTDLFFHAGLFRSIYISVLVFLLEFIITGKAASF
jgi:hypothetical protein